MIVGLMICMNPEQISIPDCTLDDPVKKSSGNISFCLIPCLHNGERLQVKLPTRFKIYSHSDSFSLGISLPENSLKFFRDLAWEQACEEQDNYDKAVYLAMSFLTPSEEEDQFMMKWIFGRPKPFCDFIFSLKNESRTNIYP